MIQFLTLYLGLIVGPHQVQVRVSDAVAAVELRLDGGVVARIESAPWRAVVDFGAAPRTHVLEAIALGDDGSELDRVIQRINRPRPEAEATLLLERDAEGRPRTARLGWQTLMEMRPLEVTVTLDGEEIELQEPDRIPLPEVDPERFHFLQAELLFANDVSARAQLGFGGGHAGEASSELTALPVALNGAREPGPAALRGRFSCRGEPLRVVAVESGPVELVVVRGDGVSEAVATIDGQPFTGAGSISVGGGPGLGVSGAAASLDDRRRRSIALPADHRLRLMGTHARRVEHRWLEMESFAVSAVLEGDRGGLFWLLSRELYAPGVVAEERVADAVAVAGMRAALGNRRRAVVLALELARSADASTLDPAAVADYLAQLGVPLYVWWLGSGPAPEAWPDAESLSGFQNLRRAARRLEKDLERQRIVWLESDCAPEAIALVPGAGLERLGAAAGAPWQAGSRPAAAGVPAAQTPNAVPCGWLRRGGSPRR